MGFGSSLVRHPDFSLIENSFQVKPNASFPRKWQDKADMTSFREADAVDDSVLIVFAYIYNLIGRSNALRSERTPTSSYPG